MSSRSSRTIYVGNLPGDIRERDIEDLFYKYGRIVNIDLKVPPRPPGYAFVEDARDAEDAIRGRDGYDFGSQRLRVELAHGGRGGHSSGGDRHRDSGGGRGARGMSRRSEFRVMVSGLPSQDSWQDLKDHMRQAGDVCFSQVFRDGSGTTGVVDYTNYEDMKYAIKKLDGSDFKNTFSWATVRVKEYDDKRDSSLKLYNIGRAFQHRQEALYNIGRAFHQVGLVTLAASYYEQVLGIHVKDYPIPKLPHENPKSEQNQLPGFCDLRREAAFNLHLIYQQCGSFDLARQVLRDHCTF